MQIKVSRKSCLAWSAAPAKWRTGAQVLEEQGLLRATGKTIVVFNARPKVKTRPWSFR